MAGEDGAGGHKGELPTLAWAWKTFWFLRGAFAAWLIVSLIPQFIPDLSKWEVLRAFHALVIEWRAALDWVASYLPKFEWYQPDGAFVFGAGVGLAIGLPAGLAFYNFENRRFRDRLISRNVFSRVFTHITLYSSVVTSVVLAATFAAVVYDPKITQQVADAASIDWVNYLVFSMLAFYVAGLLVFWVRSFFVLDGYFRGFIYVVGFLIAVETLYLMHTPGLSEWVNTRVAEVIGPDPRSE
jgi:hypothetical protein